jgi:hypothetical protein
MRLETFEMERMQSTWENIVKYDLSESGVHPVSLNELIEMGLNSDALLNTPLGYSQSNGTIELRELIAAYYPGATIDYVEVTNGTSEANYILAQALLDVGDETAFMTPNYMQLYGLGRSFGLETHCFKLQYNKDWEPDWDEFDKALTSKTRLVYITNPNNPTGSVLSNNAMKKIIESIERIGAYLIADEVYQGAELEGQLTPSFWGMSDRVLITSGLSKAYGLPGVRIGWIVGPPELIAECWRRHDYITICPCKLSDIIARTALRPDIRKKLNARTKQIIGTNKELYEQWLAGLGGFLMYTPPKAGAMAFTKYLSDIPSVELAERIRVNQNVLVVPGSHLGMEGFIRINIGMQRERFEKALERVKNELNTIK